MTSFKASQIIVENPKVAKVVFVVDRADLDYQTTKEFNAFSEGSVDGTDNTNKLVKQLADPKVNLVVTTIQKLNTAITRERHDAAMAKIKDERVVFVFDECHRSQFGETHKNIVKAFSKAQMFGFTGTPILAENAIGKKTTTDLFGDCLHKYVITDAIRDENVLRFSVEYWGKLRKKDGSLLTDDEVGGIDVKEFFEHDERIEGVVDWVIEHHNSKTHNRQFSAIMCCSSVDALTKTYETFAKRKAEGMHDLIASYLTIRRTGDETRDAFNEYWDEKREQAFKDICSEEGLNPDGFAQLMQSYQFTQKDPLADDVLPILKEPVGILQRKSVITRVIDRLKGFIETFDENMGDL